MYQQSQYQQVQEPEYKIRPTWKLAWGLMWRIWIIAIPIVAILEIIMVAID